MDARELRRERSPSGDKTDAGADGARGELFEDILIDQSILAEETQDVRLQRDVGHVRAWSFRSRTSRSPFG